MTWVDIALCITSNFNRPGRCAKKSRGAGIYLDTGGGELSRGGSRRGAELGDAVGDAMGELGVRSAPMLFLFSIIARGIAFEIDDRLLFLSPLAKSLKDLEDLQQKVKTFSAVSSRVP